MPKVQHLKQRHSGVALMILASGFFSVMFALVKGLGPTFPHFEGVFFRSLFSLPTLLWILRRGEGGGGWQQRLRPRRPGLMLLRCLFGFGGLTGYFWSVQRGKLADMAAISRTQPILIACLAPLLIGDRSPRAALIALPIGFCGALLVIKPGFGLLNLPGLVALAAVVFSALAHLTVRVLNATETPQRIVFFFVLVVGLLGGLLSLTNFVIPTPTQTLLLIGLAQCATFGQLLMTTAYGRDRAPVVAASGYASVVFALIIGLAGWGERPDALALIGAALIVGSGIYLAYARRDKNGPAPLA